MLVVALFLILKPVAATKHIQIHVKSIHIFLETAYSIKRKKVDFSLRKKIPGNV